MKTLTSILRIVALLFLFGNPSALVAQMEQPPETPESPEVLLPTMVLEAEAREDLFFVPLPLFAEPRMELPSPLKEIEAPLVFPPDFLSVSISPTEPISTSKEKTSLYTEGTLGVGTMASLEGALSLFQRGEDSKLNLKFSHRSRDGYQFHKPGNGYFDRQAQIMGEGGWSLSRATEMGMVGSIEEREIGLQGVSVSYSNLYRFVHGKGSLTHRFTDTVHLSTELGIDYANRLLTGTVPKDRSETLTKTILRLVYGKEKGALTLEGSVRGGTYSELSERGFWGGGTTLNGEWTPIPQVSIAGGIGIFWLDQLEVPFHVDLRVKPQEELLFTVQSTYMVDTVSYGILWKEVGPVAQFHSLIHPKTFTLGFRGEMKGLRDRTLIAMQGEWQRRFNGLQLLPYDTGNEHFPLNTGSLSTYKVQVEGSYNLSPGILGSIKWIWLLRDRALLEKEHTLEGSLRIAPEKRPFGGSISGVWVTSEGTALPNLTIGGYYRPRENVEISLKLEDVLYPFSSNSRFFIDPFITPGFRILLNTTITF
ncbi:MAG: hypothetical protein N2442_11245 [Spirochaetes bacterium]|nr:hypothetical protein [Spirochaetota bacterium]